LPKSAESGKLSPNKATSGGCRFNREVAVSTNDGRKLSNSSRRVPKATLVSLQLAPRPSDFGGAVPKFGFLSNLRLQPGEVEAARSSLSSAGNPSTPAPHPSTSHDSPLWSALKAFEGAPVPSQLPSPSVFASVPMPTLLAFGKAIVEVRQQALNRVRQQPTLDALGVASPRTLVNAEIAMAVNMLNAATVATNAFEASFQVTPIGMLNLERIEMTPVGIERGALIATIPLAPLEKTAVVHKEWSVTTKEFTSIVTDSLENYSETGVTENTELAQATTSQTSHSNQFNVSGTVTGTYGPVTATVSSSFTAQDQNSDSANESRKHAVATTRKASSRVKQEHKVTISTTTVTGTSETSTRVLENPSLTDPIRIDYFSMMRKWHVGLYRYGLRFTYDLAIPEPGAAMRKIYAEIADLREKLGPFTFNVPHSEITEPHYLVLAERYGAQVPPPPRPIPDVFVHINPPNTPQDGVNIIDLPPLNIPDGYWISQLLLSFHFETPSGPHQGILSVLWTTYSSGPQNQLDSGPIDLTSFFLHQGGQLVLSCRLDNLTNISIHATAKTMATPASIARWQSDVWNALYNAAQTQYYAKQQDIQTQIAALEEKISNVDTLTLRREENEEIMKGVLRWLLGPNFHFMPDDVLAQFLLQAPLFIINPNGNIDLIHGTVLDATRGDGLNVTAAGWYPMFMYQEMVKFINEAIDWENVLYFLYSYFWDVPPSWDFIRQLRHPDSTRQAFLRAGSARVVLTVRKGWETAWVSFVEAGGFGKTLLPNHPYMSIATEIRDYDLTNYPGIPPANPGGGPLPDAGESVATQSSDSHAASASPVTITVASSVGFIAGYTAIIDDYASGSVVNGRFVTIQEIQTIVAVPDATHITVKGLNNAHDGSTRPFAIRQGGEKGQLIAEWFEYTPTSGTDIAVTSNLATIE